MNHNTHQVIIFHAFHARLQNAAKDNIYQPQQSTLYVKVNFS